MRQDADRADARTNQDADRAATGLSPRRVSVQEAAQILGTTVEGIRSRLKRGTLTRERTEDGTVYVLLPSEQNGDRTNARASQDADRTNHAGDRASQDADLAPLVEELRREVEAWREEARRKDAILMQMAQANAALAARVPELEPASYSSPDERERSQNPWEKRGDSQDHHDNKGPEKRSWLARFFGLE